MCTFICIGGLCFVASMLNCNTHKNIKHLRTPINNVEIINGFLDSHKLFDGTFKDEVLTNKRITYYYNSNDRFPNQWLSSTYRFLHLNLNLPISFIKLEHRLNDTLNFINKPDDDYWFLYSLNKKDVKLSAEQIKNQLNILSKYINTDRILFLGSIRYNGNLTEIDGNPVSLAKFDYRNENFKDIVGDRYIEIYPSNVFNIAYKNFINILNDRKLMDLEIATCEE